MPYPARAVVDLDAIAANVGTLRAAAPTAQLMAVVKGDAYGHGLVPCARAALDGGAQWLGVAQLGEALSLREAGVTARLLTWLFVPGAPLGHAVAADIDLSVGSSWALAEVVAAARALGRPARIHLKIDTGMARGGQFAGPFAELATAALAAQRTGDVRVVGVWSHLVAAESQAEPDVALSRAQTDAVRSAARLLIDGGAELEVRHLANSAGTLGRPETHLDLVRPGIALYGLSPFPGRTSADLGLLPAMRLEAQVMLTKEAPAGQGVSYNHTYRTTASTVLADIPLGYADGIPRSASGTGPVLLGGERRTIAGRVCMDQFVVDLGPSSRVRPGDVAVLFGTGAGGEPTAADWAQAAGTISYEIVTRLGTRVPRHYVGERAPEFGA